MWKSIFRQYESSQSVSQSVSPFVFQSVGWWIWIGRSVSRLVVQLLTQIDTQTDRQTDRWSFRQPISPKSVGRQTSEHGRDWQTKTDSRDNPGQNSWDMKAITRKNDVFSTFPSPRCNEVIFGRLNIAREKGGQKIWFTKTTLPTFFKRWIQSLFNETHFLS